MGRECVWCTGLLWTVEFHADSPNEELTSTTADFGELLGHWGGGLHDIGATS